MSVSHVLHDDPFRILITAALLAISGYTSTAEAASPRATTVVPPEIVEAVGWIVVLEGEHTGSCTATLVASDLVATAGHCVGRALPRQLRFLASGNIWIEVLEVVEVGVVFDGQKIEGERGGEDWAIVRVRPTHRTPIAVAPLGPGELEALARSRSPIHIYGHGGADQQLSETEPCTLLPNRYDGFFATTCDTSLGDSGAPVLLMTKNGPRLIAVHSGSSEDGSFEISAAQFVHLLP